MDSEETDDRSQYERVKELILYGKVRPGQKLTESFFADAIQTSRVPVREAIQQLFQEGFIVRGGKSGYQIKVFDEQDIIDLYNYREALEGMLVRLFTERAGDSQIFYLEIIVQNFKKIANDFNPTALYQSDVDFHQTIARGAKNSLMEQQHKIVLEKVLYMSRSFLFFGDGQIPEFLDKAHLEGIYDEHAQILEVIKTRDADAAESAARKNIQSGLIRMLRSLAHQRHLGDGTTYP